MQKTTSAFGLKKAKASVSLMAIHTTAEANEEEFDGKTTE
jgi:hypothetical protein